MILKQKLEEFKNMMNATQGENEKLRTHIKDLIHNRNAEMAYQSWDNSKISTHIDMITAN